MRMNLGGPDAANRTASKSFGRNGTLPSNEQLNKQESHEAFIKHMIHPPPVPEHEMLISHER